MVKEHADTHALPPSDRHDTGLIRAQFGIVHDCDPESPRFSFSLESIFVIYSGLAPPCIGAGARGAVGE
jgi:hypothetical protein